MRPQFFEFCSFAPFVAIHQLAEVGLCFNVVLIFAVFKVFLHNSENSLNCPAASSALVGSKLISEAVQEVGTHTRIIAVREVATKIGRKQCVESPHDFERPHVAGRVAPKIILTLEGIVGHNRTLPLFRFGNCRMALPYTR
jgi:hypothetical protein